MSAGDSCLDSGVSRSACHFGHAPELTTSGTTPPLFLIDGSSIEHRQYKKVHLKKRDSVGEMKGDNGRVESVGSCHAPVRVTKWNLFNVRGWNHVINSCISANCEGESPTSSTDVGEQIPYPTEVGKTSKESVSVEQGQLLRAAEPVQYAPKVTSI